MPPARWIAGVMLRPAASSFASVLSAGSRQNEARRAAIVVGEEAVQVSPSR